MCMSPNDVLLVHARLNEATAKAGDVGTTITLRRVTMEHCRIVRVERLNQQHADIGVAMQGMSTHLATYVCYGGRA